MHPEDIAKSIQKKSCKICSQEFTGTVSICPHDGTLLTPIIADPFIGTLLGDRYKIISLAGRGGMGSVYRGTHMLMDRQVAIKLLHAHLISDTHALQRFQQEAKASCALTHPNIIAVYDFGIAPQGQPYLVMEYVKGHSLSEIIEREGCLSPARVLHIFNQACAGLAHAHEHGVVHRDLKPSNIILTSLGQERNFVKIVDFGIAKLMPSAGRETMNLTQTGEIFGSPLYMSPEQCMAQQLDARADIYSLGCVIYESLTGVPPLIGKHSVDTIQKHVNEMPRPLKYAKPDISIPDGMEPVIFKALAKDPNQRYQSMNELKEDLEKIASGMRPGMVAPAVADNSSKKGAAPPAKGQSQRESAPSGEPASQSSQAATGRSAEQFEKRRGKIPVPVITSLVVLSIGIAAGTWTCFNGLWCPPFLDPIVLWNWYTQAEETAKKEGRYADAEKWGNMATRAADRLEEPKLRMARSLNLLGEIFIIEKKYPDAEIVLQKALSVRDHAHSLDNPDGVSIMTDLARLYELEGKYSFAEMQYEQLLANEKRMFGENHPEVARAYVALAKVHKSEGETADAYKQYLHAISIIERNAGLNSKLLAPLLHECAALLKEMNRKPEADKLIKRALQIEKKEHS